MPRIPARKRENEERKLYIVKRRVNMPADDPRRQELVGRGLPWDAPCLVEAETIGPMSKAEAQRLGVEIADADGSANICEADTGRQVASVWDGGLFLEYEYNKMGDKLPIDDENCFWTGVSRT